MYSHFFSSVWQMKKIRSVEDYIQIDTSDPSCAANIFSQNGNNYESHSLKCPGYLNVSHNYSQATNFSHIKQYSKQSTLKEYNSGVGLPLPIECFAHGSGHTLVRVEYGYLMGSPNANSYRKKSAATALNIVLTSVHSQMTSWCNPISTDNCKNTCQNDLLTRFLV
jgi:hypothetical protein